MNIIPAIKRNKEITMKHLKKFKNYKINEDNHYMFKSTYDKQSDGEFIEIFDKKTNNLVAEFEYFGNGIFKGSDYTHNSKDASIIDLSDGFKLSDEMTAKELNNMLNEFIENYQDLISIGDGYVTFKERFKEFI